MRLTTLLLTAAVAAAVVADNPVKEAPRVLKPSEAGVGRLVPDVAFTDTAGKPGRSLLSLPRPYVTHAPMLGRPCWPWPECMK